MTRRLKDSYQSPAWDYYSGNADAYTSSNAYDRGYQDDAEQYSDTSAHRDQPQAGQNYQAAGQEQHAHRVQETHYNAPSTDYHWSRDAQSKGQQTPNFPILPYLMVGLILLLGVAALFL